MHQTLLMQECKREKRKFFFYLSQGIESEVPQIYENAVQILAEFIDKRIVILLYSALVLTFNLFKPSFEEVQALNSTTSAIKLLLPSHHQESDQNILTRHYAALEVLTYLDENHVRWGNQFNSVLQEYDGLKTLLYYLENQSPHQEWQKKQACQTLGMMTEEPNPPINKEVAVLYSLSYITHLT